MDASQTPNEKYVRGLKVRENTPCVVCEEGTLKVSTFTKTKTGDGTTLIVKGVPALLCDACGDVTYTQAIGQQIDELWASAVETNRPTIVHTFGAKGDL